MHDPTPLPPVDQPMSPPPSPNWFIVLLTLLGLVIAGAIVGSVLQLGAALAFGIDIQDLLAVSGVEFSTTERTGLRIATLLNHLFIFSIPPLVTACIFYRPRWVAYLGLRPMPELKASAYAILFILLSFPLVQLSYYFNQQLPLFDWMVDTESATNAMIAGLLQMDSLAELLLSLLTIAVVPAIGEELLFRGVIQQEIEKGVRNGHLAVWLTAFIFSAIHLQFAGFLPRMLLGAVLGYLMLWTRNLWLPILGHFFFNGTQVIAVYISGDMAAAEEMLSEEELREMLPSLLIVSAICTVLLYYLGRRFRSAAHVDRN